MKKVASMMILLMIMGCARISYIAPVPGCQVSATDSSNPNTPNGGAVISCNGQVAYIDNGSNGTNATPVTTVQLCQGTSTYGASYEYGICIQGSLYALSLNSGSHDLIIGVLSPGRYVDENGNKGCNFTLVSGCTVSN